MLLDDNSKFVSKKQQISKLIFAHLFHLLTLAASGGVLLYLNDWLSNVHEDKMRGIFIALVMLLAFFTRRLRIGGEEYEWVASVYVVLFFCIVSMGVAGALLRHLEINAWEEQWKVLYKYYFVSIYYLAYTLVTEFALFISFIRRVRKYD
ncbi:MAG: hypothetical protein MK212_18335 [Saprospiraceae bacterium]|nr:hypothetical protein [Saprospiraceae bacterium]